MTCTIRTHSLPQKNPLTCLISFMLHNPFYVLPIPICDVYDFFFFFYISNFIYLVGKEKGICTNYNECHLKWKTKMEKIFLFEVDYTLCPHTSLNSFSFLFLLNVSHLFECFSCNSGKVGAFLAGSQGP